MSRGLRWAVVLGMAWASVGHAEPRRQWLGARPVERPIVLPRGWVEVATDVALHRVDGQYAGAGERDDSMVPTREDSVGLAVRWGGIDRLELNASGRYERLSVDGVQRVGVADVDVGARMRLLSQDLPLASLVGQVVVRLPTGWRDLRLPLDDQPTMRPLPLGHGTVEVRPAIRMRRQFDAVRLDVDAYGVVQVPRSAGGVLVDWADAAGVRFGGLLQMGPAALQADVAATRWGRARVGALSFETSGWDVTTHFGVTLSLNRSVDVHWSGRHVLRGRSAIVRVPLDLTATFGSWNRFGLSARF